MLQVKKPFICGTCEGFYGKPWSFSQRQELFKRMKRFNMNTYLYAPKDDCKHRLYWRELYTPYEADELRYLIKCAEDNGISFVYAISPGLDVVYSSVTELNTLKKKLDQVKSLGCRCFALLFDDIEDDLCIEDASKFASIADAQAFLTNEVFNHLSHPDLFLFCPTEYCSSRSLPTVKDSPYLKTLGLRLDQRIDFFWTGPKVVSRKITVENIEEVSAVMKRQVTIWDNIHANDYDQSRIYLGPFDGRPSSLVSHLRGVLTNPNCEFEANFIALHTLAQWSRNAVMRFPVSNNVEEMEVEEESKDTYEPRKALEMAIHDWLPELYKAKSSFGVKPEKKEEEEEKDVELEDKSEGRKMEEDVSMATEEETRKKWSRKWEGSLYWEEVQMVCDFFYLPFEHGPMGEKMLNAAKWLVDHFHLVFHPDHNRYGAYLHSNTNPSYTQHVNLPLTNTTAAILGASASSPESPITDASISPPTHPPPHEHPPSVEEIKKETFDTSCANSSTTGSKHPPPPPTITTSYYYDNDSYLGGGASSASDWYERAIRFHDGYGDLSAIVDKLVNIPNRELLYELYKYINDIRSNLALVNSYIKWHGIDKRDKELFKSGEQEPWVHRGGLLAEFRRLLPFETSRSNNIYIVRPYYAKDYYNVCNLCLKTFNDLTDASHWLANPPTLLADCMVGLYLVAGKETSFVIEDSLGLCGYALAFKHHNLLMQAVKGEWMAELKQKYPEVSTNSDKSTKTDNQTSKMSTASLASLAKNASEEATKSTEPSQESPKEHPPSPVAEDEPMSAASSSDHSRSASPDSKSFSYPYSTLLKHKLPFASAHEILQLLHSDKLHHVTSLLSSNHYSSFLNLYPSPVVISLSRYKEKAARMLLSSVEQALIDSQSQGMHVLLPSNHKSTIDLYTNLGFQQYQQEVGEITGKGYVIMCKSLPLEGAKTAPTSNVPSPPSDPKPP